MQNLCRLFQYFRMLFRKLCEHYETNHKNLAGSNYTES